jgi:hypothetical protein
MLLFVKFSRSLAAVAFLLLCPLLLSGQTTMQNDQSELGQKTASTHHMVNVTGCLKKGSEEGGYYITDKSGTTWELGSKIVDLSEHVNHVVSVAGHEMQRSKTDETKTEQSEKSESGGNKYFDLNVAQLKMVSPSCTR